MDLISIAVALYNQEKYIKDCVESILNQTYPNIEVIIVNDKSTDNSMNILNEFSTQEKIIIINHEENLGLSQTRNTGLRESRGKYICFVDADDTLSPHYIEELYLSIQRYGTNISICGYLDYNSEFQKKVSIKNNLGPLIKIDDNLLKNQYSNICSNLICSDSWNKMYEVEFIKSNKIFFEMNKKLNGTDFLFNHLIILQKPTVSIVNKHLYFHRIVINSRVRRKGKDLWSAFSKITKELLQETKKLKYFSKVKLEISKIHIKLVRRVLLDFYYESNNLTEFCSKVKVKMKEIRTFNKTHNLKLSLFNAETRSLKIFILLLGIHSDFLLYIYFKVIIKNKLGVK